MVKQFPEGFLWGVATSAHQTEGNNTNCDVWVEENAPGTLFAEPSGDAIDHWNRYESDIALIAQTGLKVYRFSVEWARVETEPGVWDEAALDHYKDVCAACLKHGVEPIITLHHFTSPKWLMRYGGWKGAEIPKLFARYAVRVIQHMGSFVKKVVTINECNISYIIQEYRAILAEMRGKNSLDLSSKPEWLVTAAQECGTDVETYCSYLMVSDEVAIATIKAAHLAAREAIKTISPKTEVGLSLSLQQVQAMHGGESAALKAWDLHFTQWLPLVDQDDFIGIQVYTRNIYGANGKRVPVGTLTQMGYEYAPEALAAVVRDVARSTQTPILVTESGVATDDDAVRVDFIGRVLSGLHACIGEGIKILGYTYWSAFDNFEWHLGYGMRFGVIAVDRMTQVRCLKPSAYYLGEIAQNNAIPASIIHHPQSGNGTPLSQLQRSE